MKRIAIWISVCALWMVAACGDDSGGDDNTNTMMPTGTQQQMDGSTTMPTTGTSGTGSTAMPTTGEQMPMIETMTVPCGTASCMGLSIPGISLPAPCCYDEAAGQCGTMMTGGTCEPPPPSDPRCPAPTGLPVSTCCGAGGSCGFNTGGSCFEIPEAFRPFASALLGEIVICDGDAGMPDADGGQ